MSLHGTIRQVYLLKRLLQVYCNGANRSSYRVFTERGLRMYLAINIVGLIVFLFIGFLFSKDKKNINWKAIAIMVVINIVLAAFLIGSPVGRHGVQAAADGFVWLVDASAKGTTFALGSWYNAKNLNFICSALMPILMVVPMFDIGSLMIILTPTSWGVSGLHVSDKRNKFNFPRNKQAVIKQVDRICHL